MKFVDNELWWDLDDLKVGLGDLIVGNVEKSNGSLPASPERQVSVPWRSIIHIFLFLNKIFSFEGGK